MNTIIFIEKTYIGIRNFKGFVKKEKSKKTIDFSTSTQDRLLQQLVSLEIPKNYKDY